MKRLLAYFEAERGRRARLAEALHISPSAISMWPRVPADRLIDVEKHTGVPRHELRPDLYPAPSATEAA